MEDKFLRYTEGLLSREEKESFEKELENSSELKKGYEEFLVLYKALSAMQVKDAKAPSELLGSVMAEVEKTKPIFTWSSIMSKKGKLALFAIPVCLLAGIVILNCGTSGSTTSGEISVVYDGRLRSSVAAIFNYIEGALGTLIMLACAALAFICVFLPKEHFRRKWVAAPAFATCAISVLVLRNLTSTFFPDVFSASYSMDQTARSTDSMVNTVYDGRLKSPLSRLSKVFDSGSSVGSTTSNEYSAPAKRIDPSDFGLGGEIEDGRKWAPPSGSRLIPLTDDEPSNLRPNAFVDRAPINPIKNESYNSITENGFQSPLQEALSTFSIDVDTASYSNVRRMLNANSFPTKDAVRIEEMVNYFKYDLEKPEDKSHPFAVTTELSPAPWKSGHQLLRIGLQGYEESLDNLPPSNLVFLIDVSGSMNPPNRLPLVKQGLNLLVDRLRAEDKISIVTYANNTKLVLDSAKGSDKNAIKAAINSLYANGGTYGESGINMAYDVATRNFIKGGNNRIILASDGDFNIGMSSTSELENLIERKRESGVFLSVFGFGMGNYRDNRLERLADKGNGNYGYIDSILEVKKTLLDGITGTLFTIAKDVKIQVEFNPAYVNAYRLIGYENRRLNKEDFNDDTKDAGELGVGHTVTALYEIVPAGVNYQGSVDELKYQKVEEKKGGVENNELATVKLRYKLPNAFFSTKITKVVNADSLATASQEQTFAAAVAEFGMLLRNSQYKGNATYADVIKLAKQSFGADENGDRHEFVKLVEKAELLAR